MARDGENWQTEAARRSLEILLPRMEKSYAEDISAAPKAWGRFKDRLEHEWERLFGYLHELYGWQYDFFHTLEQVLDMLASHWHDRSDELRALDERRAADAHRIYFDETLPVGDDLVLGGYGFAWIKLSPPPV